MLSRFNDLRFVFLINDLLQFCYYPAPCQTLDQFEGATLEHVFQVLLLSHFYLELQEWVHHMPFTILACETQKIKIVGAGFTMTPEYL